MINEKIKLPFRRLQWKLTLSYTTVTLGSLIIAVIILGYILFSRIFIPLDIYDSVVTPEEWIRLVREDAEHIWTPVLSQDPIDTDLISGLLQESDLQITFFDLIQIGDFQIRVRTVGQGSVLIVAPDGTLLGTSNPNFVPENAIGQLFDVGILSGLEEPFQAALNGELDPERLFVTLDPRERFYFAVPLMKGANQEVLGVAVVNMEHIPTANDVPTTIWMLLVRSVLILLIGAGIVGTFFGAITASGITSRLERVSQVTDAWSQGDFSDFIEDSTGDEISQLGVRLNHMAEQLQQFLKRSQEIAVSEERNRLARELHDSAKQEALAASFHLGTALTLFDRDHESAKMHVVEADNLVDSVRGELTDLIHELRPPSTNGKHFDETLNEYIIDWTHQTDIEANLVLDGFIDVPLEIKQAIFRIMQEALANVARHSSAQRVEVNLSSGEESIDFCVSDDGMGFDAQQQHQGIGLDSMRERVEALNGEFTIQSEPGRGTRICAIIPFD